jgi:hypothetical protein
MCWATDSTVSGVRVNDSGWVPEVWFDWNWDDNSLGTVVRGGIIVDLGKSIGLVAAHAFKPTVYAESCGGGTNSLHTVTLTVYSVVGVARESASATMSVCVENPATTWPNPVAYCDDADCSNDSFTGVTNPGTPTHGGNGTALQTILAECASVSKRVLLEGGVRFTTGSNQIVMGANRCLIESYGTGNAELAFTYTGSNSLITVSSANRAGVVFNDLTFVGPGGGFGRLIAGHISGGPGQGVYALIDSGVSQTVGEEFLALTIADPAGFQIQSEGYYFRFTFDTQVGDQTQFFIWGEYTAIVGSELSGQNVANNNLIRLPQWNHVVIDANRLQDDESHIMTLRQDCGGAASCTEWASAEIAAITRNEMLAQSKDASCTLCTEPIEMCTSGSGTGEPTKCYDIDILANSMTWDRTPTDVDEFITLQGGAAAGTEIKRVRVMQNALDISAQDSTNSRMLSIGPADDIALIGNVIVDTGAFTTSRVMSNGSTQLDVVKNNGCFDAGNHCDMFPSFAEDTTCNPEVTSNPFSVSPGTLANFDFTDVTPTNGGAFDDKCTSPTPYPTDVAGNACDSLYDVGPYCVP